MTRAAIEAERLLEDLGIEQLPVALEDICMAMSSPSCQITITEEEMNSGGFHGISMGDSNGAAILINKNINSRHRKRFTAAHEIGHVYLHILTGEKSKFQCTAKDISSNSDSNNDYEKEANEFASSLLMPAPIIASKVQQNDLSWSLIEEIKNICDVSLEAAARRTIALSKEPICLIIHKTNVMWAPVKSQSFYSFIPNQPFPNHLHTEPDNNFSDSLPDDMDECDFSDWDFPDNACIGKLYYSSIHNDEFNRTMTLLFHAEDELDEDYDDEPRF